MCILWNTYFFKKNNFFFNLVLQQMNNHIDFIFYFTSRSSHQRCSVSREQLVYKVFCTRYQVPFTCKDIKLLLKHCKISKYYDQDFKYLALNMHVCFIVLHKWPGGPFPARGLDLPKLLLFLKALVGTSQKAVPIIWCKN